MKGILGEIEGADGVTYCIEEGLSLEEFKELVKDFDPEVKEAWMRDFFPHTHVISCRDEDNWEFGVSKLKNGDWQWNLTSPDKWCYSLNTNTRIWNDVSYERHIVSDETFEKEIKGKESKLADMQEALVNFINEYGE